MKPPCSNFGIITAFISNVSIFTMSFIFSPQAQQGIQYMQTLFLLLITIAKSEKVSQIRYLSQIH